jgi:hypothetical protein
VENVWGLTVITAIVTIICFCAIRFFTKDKPSVDWFGKHVSLESLIFSVSFYVALSFMVLSLYVTAIPYLENVCTAPVVDSGILYILAIIIAGGIIRLFYHFVTFVCEKVIKLMKCEETFILLVALICIVFFGIKEKNTYFLLSSISLIAGKFFWFDSCKETFSDIKKFLRSVPVLTIITCSMLIIFLIVELYFNEYRFNFHLGLFFGMIISLAIFIISFIKK